MKSDCHTAQDKYDERERNGELGAMEARPRCDGKGKFYKFECVPAQTCFCQSDDGRRLFGEVLNLGVITEKSMHCDDKDLDLFAEFDQEHPSTFQSPCLLNQERIAAEILDAEEDEFDLDYFGGFPECLPDWTYGRIAVNSAGQPKRRRRDELDIYDKDWPQKTINREEWKRKKTTIDILDRLETDIKRIERDGQYKEQTHKRVIGYIMAYSVGLYVLFAILYYYMYVGKSQHWMYSLLYASPLLVLPVLVIFLRSAISWYYNWSLNKNRIKLSKMREEKKKILEEVAKEILDKYGSPEEQSKALKPFVPSTNVPGNTPSTPVPATPGQLRQRQMAMQTSTPINNNRMLTNKINIWPSTIGHYSVSSCSNSKNKLIEILFQIVSLHNTMQSDQLPRPLPERNRSALDKVVDFLLKDGPNHRMALICSECSSHNVIYEEHA
ncbi:unnamed protein product [Spodoptera littoralis]|uniref:Endoplasmic reticulum junction formation protein lunapark n=1 Tax=Spodoptera littoralis TaxID=7109 RepID=A0A9P0N349_SPOLI|nr:unnamed protein product [Spodoptera littoralis]